MGIYKIRLTSSLEKPMTSDTINKFPPLKRVSVLKGERLSFQVLLTNIDECLTWRGVAGKVSLSGELSKYASVRDLAYVPIAHPTLQHDKAWWLDDNYVSKNPGIFPDLLRPLHSDGRVFIPNSLLTALWVEVNVPKKIKAGEYTLTVTVNVDDEDDCNKISLSETLTLELINAALPDDEIYYTNWFHCDCLASYYNVKMWSRRHWEIIENFMRVAKKNGINMIYTPLLTPPLNTAVGGERPTTQLVGVTVTNGKYSFDFTLLDKWVKLCDKVGFKYFEINHLFTQWGASHAPKVMATVDGEKRRIFGWETDSHGEEYVRFLREMLGAFISHMKKSGNDKRLFFHISDEPRAGQIESYRKAKESISDILEGYVVMDALSHLDFYLDGSCDNPIPANNRIAPFIEAKVKNLWTYSSCTQATGVSNRFIAMPGWRNRSIGFQMYKYGIVGFLHWGYNFYFNQHSKNLINPYVQGDGDLWIEPGDAFSVYPDMDGTALESTRIITFFEALQDLKAMKLCEKYYGKEIIVKIIDEAIGCDVTFHDCATSAAQIIEIREKINLLIKKAVK